MLNKKILAAAVVAGLSNSAIAAVDLTDADTALTIASETITVLNGDGLLAVSANTVADVTVPAGFTVAAGTSKYVRIKLTNGEFDGVASLTSAVVNFSATVSQGGADGDTSVIFEITSTSNDILAASVLTLVNAGYAVDDSAGMNVDYALYETAADAVNEINSLSTQSGPVFDVASGSSGMFATANTRVSTVSSSFMQFQTTGDNAAISTTLADLGTLDGTLIVAGTTYTPALTVVTAGDLISTTQDVTITGDFSYGTFTLEDSVTCAALTPIAATVATDGASAAFTGVDLVTAELTLCLEVDGTSEVIQKDAYTATLDVDDLTNDIGEIKYDTTSIEVPYLTTFTGLNQRIYLVNYGSTEAAYTITFVSEAGVTATPGMKATGVVPAGEMIAVKAVDVVTLVGKTRTSAIIEVESTDEDVAATMQTVNLSNNGTDTVVLN